MGRTGTLLGLLRVMSDVDKMSNGDDGGGSSNAVDVYGVVFGLRCQRVQMVSFYC